MPKIKTTLRTLLRATDPQELYSTLCLSHPGLDYSRYVDMLRGMARLPGKKIPKAARAALQQSRHPTARCTRRWKKNAPESDSTLQQKAHEKGKAVPQSAVKGTLRDLTNSQRKKKRTPPAQNLPCFGDAKRVATEDRQWQHSSQSNKPEIGRDSGQSTEPDPESARGQRTSDQSADCQPPHDPLQPAAGARHSQMEVVRATGSCRAGEDDSLNFLVLANDQSAQLSTTLASSSISREVELLREARAREAEFRNREAALMAQVLEERGRRVALMAQVLEERNRRHRLALSAQNLVHNYELEISRLSVRAKLELVAKDVQWMLRSACGGSARRTTTDTFKALRCEFAKYRANGYTAAYSICKALDDTSHAENVPQDALLNILDTIYPRLSGNSHFATTDVLNKNAFTDPKEFLVVRALFKATGIPYIEPTPAAQLLRSALNQVGQPDSFRDQAC